MAEWNTSFSDDGVVAGMDVGDSFSNGFCDARAPSSGSPRSSASSPASFSSDDVGSSHTRRDLLRSVLSLPLPAVLAFRAGDFTTQLSSSTSEADRDTDADRGALALRRSVLFSPASRVPSATATGDDVGLALDLCVSFMRDALRSLAGVPRPLRSSLQLLLSAKNESSCVLLRFVLPCFLIFNFSFGLSTLACWAAFNCSPREDGGEFSAPREPGLTARTVASLCGLYPGENPLERSRGMASSVDESSYASYCLSAGVPRSFRYGFITLRRLLTPGLGSPGGMASARCGVLSSGARAGGLGLSVTDFFRRLKNEECFLASVGGGGCSFRFCIEVAVWGTRGREDLSCDAM